MFHLNTNKYIKTKQTKEYLKTKMYYTKANVIV